MHCTAAGQARLSRVAHTGHGGLRGGGVATACTLHRDAIPVPEGKSLPRARGRRRSKGTLLNGSGRDVFRVHGGPLTPSRDAKKVLRGRRRVLRSGPYRYSWYG